MCHLAGHFGRCPQMGHVGRRSRKCLTQPAHTSQLCPHTQLAWADWRWVIGGYGVFFFFFLIESGYKRL